MKLFGNSWQRARWPSLSATQRCLERLNFHLPSLSLSRSPRASVPLPFDALTRCVGLRRTRRRFALSFSFALSLSHSAPRDSYARFPSLPASRARLDASCTHAMPEQGVHTKFWRTRGVRCRAPRWCHPGVRTP